MSTAAFIPMDRAVSAAGKLYAERKRLWMNERERIIERHKRKMTVRRHGFLWLKKDTVTEEWSRQEATRKRADAQTRILIGSSICHPKTLMRFHAF